MVALDFLCRILFLLLLLLLLFGGFCLFVYKIMSSRWSILCNQYVFYFFFFASLNITLITMSIMSGGIRYPCIFFLKRKYINIFFILLRMIGAYFFLAISNSLKHFFIPTVYIGSLSWTHVCYLLDFKCPLKAQVFKACSPALGTVWR